MFASIASIAFVETAHAQQVRGTVGDSASRQPVPGAVLTLLDRNGSPIGRSISGKDGAYRISPSAGARATTLHVVRIGFRPRDLSLPAPTDAVVVLNVLIAALPTMLEPVRVTDQPNCPARKDRAAAFSLWEQTKSALLATIVAREANPAAMLRIGYERTMDGGGEHILSQRVRLDSTDRGLASFQAAHSAADFVRDGFRDVRGASDVFMAPDAEVLLDDRFVAGYCFRIVNADRARPTEVGLGFEAAGHKRDRVDIDGTVWIDTAARALRNIEYKYVGLDRRVEALNPGGRLEFREMPNGVVLVDRWHIRLVVAESTSALTPTLRRGESREVVSYVFSAQESGGELARAAWPTERPWLASLGTLRARAVTRTGGFAGGTVVRLDDTDYRATVSDSGTFEIANLVPGPYSLVVVDPRLAAVRLTIPTKIAFVAARDSVYQAALTVPTAEDFVADRCIAERRMREVHAGSLNVAMDDSTPWAVIRVMRPDATPIAGVKITLAQRQDPTQRDPRDILSPVNEWVPVPDSYETGTNGLFTLCRNLRRGWDLKIRARGPGGADAETIVRVKDKLTIVPFVVDAPHPREGSPRTD
ncbi:MAG: carboxypeptidase-like regulatory domain-containing protein [Gemmatimonadaceae bacterium]